MRPRRELLIGKERGEKGREVNKFILGVKEGESH